MGFIQTVNRWLDEISPSRRPAAFVVTRESTPVLCLWLPPLGRGVYVFTCLHASQTRIARRLAVWPRNDGRFARDSARSGGRSLANVNPRSALFWKRPPRTGARATEQKTDVLVIVFKLTRKPYFVHFLSRCFLKLLGPNFKSTGSELNSW